MYTHQVLILQYILGCLCWLLIFVVLERIVKWYNTPNTNGFIKSITMYCNGLEKPKILFVMTMDWNWFIYEDNNISHLQMIFFDQYQLCAAILSILKKKWRPQILNQIKTLNPRLFWIKSALHWEIVTYHYHRIKLGLFTFYCHKMIHLISPLDQHCVWELL